MSMNKLILPVLAIIILLFLVAGNSNGGSEEAAVSSLATVTDVDQLNDAIEEGPVLVEIGTSNCPSCAAQKPILIDIANDYHDKASVIYIDASKSRLLVSRFNVYSVPDMFVIVENTDKGYVYMDTEGKTTTDRNEARFVGLTSKGTLTDALDAAIEYRQ